MHEVLNAFDVAALEQHLQETFLRPEPPMPVLRREAKGFDTVVQDALAYPVEEDQGVFGFAALVDPDVEQAVDVLDVSAQTLYKQFEGRQDCIDLVRTRWNLPKSAVRLAICDTACSSLATSGESELACPCHIPPLVNQLFNAVKKAAKFQCEYHLRELLETQSGGEFLSEYVRRVRD